MNLRKQRVQNLDHETTEWATDLKKKASSIHTELTKTLGTAGNKINIAENKNADFKEKVWDKFIEPRF